MSDQLLEYGEKVNANHLKRILDHIFLRNDAIADWRRPRHSPAWWYGITGSFETVYRILGDWLEWVKLSWLQWWRMEYIKDIQFLNKIDHLIGDKIIQVLIQLGENGEFLKSNIPKEKFFNNSSRATFQVAEKTLYATYDQYNVSVKIPDVDDTVRLLNKYYYNRDLIARDGEKCRDRILSKFRPEKICQDLINILEE